MVVVSFFLPNMSPNGDFRKESPMVRLFVALAVLMLTLSPALARADDSLHGPEAPANQFPSHVFQLAAHQPERVQLALHAGLLQPLVLHGVNAAVDVRYKRLVLTYSHGAALDVTPFVNATERAAGMKLHEPWTTGGGVGVLLIDELWVLADFKVHRFEAETAAESKAYTNITIGAEIGWRYFLWKGLNIGVVARFWPNVHSSAGGGITMHDARGRAFVHQPQAQGYAGFFGNVLLGYAFNL